MSNYETYREMYETSQKLEKAVRAYYEKKGYKVYSAYVSVGKEDERLYFVDIEVGGSPDLYKRIYGLKEENTLINTYMNGDNYED